MTIANGLWKGELSDYALEQLVESRSTGSKAKEGTDGNS